VNQSASHMQREPAEPYDHQNDDDQPKQVTHV
jgi:hypothetical protein